MKPFIEITDTTEKDASEIHIGGIARFTTIDFPGVLSAVLFVKGCPWKCLYCQNPELQSRSFSGNEEKVSWDYVEHFLSKRKGLIDGVVFSGGEPCSDPALADAVRQVKKKGYQIGLHTGGMYPRRLRQILPELDWVGLDVKGSLTDENAYDKIVGRKGSLSHVKQSLELLLDSDLRLEVRTTAHPDYLSEKEIIELAEYLKEVGVKTYALQIYRQPRDVPEENCLPRVGSDYLGPQLIEQLDSMFENFILRRP